MLRIKLFLVMFFFVSTCFAMEDSIRIVKEVAWPNKYEGETIPLIVGDFCISIPISMSIEEIIYNRDGILVNLEDNRVLGVNVIDSDFYDSSFVVNDATDYNNISVSLIGKIPFLHTKIPEDIDSSHPDYKYWAFSIATRNSIYRDDNMVEMSENGPIQVFYYQPVKERSYFISQLHSDSEEEFVMFTAGGFEREEFLNIIGSVESAD